MKRKRKCLHCGFMKLSLAFEPDEPLSPTHWMPLLTPPKNAEVI